MMQTRGGGRKVRRPTRWPAASLLLLGLTAAGCSCGGSGALREAVAEIDATGPVVADGVRASLVTVRLLDAPGGEPLSGFAIEIVTDRGDDDVIEQPASPTDANGVTTGRIRSAVAGTVVVTVLAGGEPVDGSATLEFVSGVECVSGEEAPCYEGPDGTLDVGRCRAGVRVCGDDGRFGPCEGQVLPAEVDGIPCNGVDDNCDGTLDTHMDRSDPDSCGTCGNVCPDYPGAVRSCDAETGTCEMGACLPGFYDLNGDPSDGCEYACDGDPEAEEICDGTDTNCNGRIDDGPGGLFDVDGDGFTTCGTDFVNGGTHPDLVDCDDLDPNVYPGAPSRCDGKDTDCSGEVGGPDEDCAPGPCQESGRCESGECVFDPVDCAHLDGPCTTGMCDEDTGSCVSVFAPPQTPCDAGSCASTCGADGVCIPCDCEGASDCDDGVSCTVSACVDGQCVFTPDDGQCTSDAVCETGRCEPAAGGCVFETEPLEGLTCEMADGCAGSCADGLCFGCECVAVGDCPDAGECGVASCEAGRCAYAANDDACADLACAVATCDTDSLTCVLDSDPREGQLCEVGACSGICNDGQCLGCDCELDTDCDDGVECTVNGCVDGVCQNVPDDALCDDGDACTGLATCDPALGCVAGTPLVCEDGDACTLDLCDPGTGCVFPVRAPDMESMVAGTTACLTTGAEGRAVVLVDLRDETGLPYEGASVVFSVSGTAVSWVEADVVESAAAPGIYYRTLIAPAAGSATTVTVQATGCGETVTLEQSVTIVYEDGVAGDRGETGGCSPQAGNLRVRVVDEAGSPLAGAFVMVGDAEDTQAFHPDFESYLAGGPGSDTNATTTDAAGYATFFDAGLALTQADVITAGAVDRAYVSLIAVGASDVTLALPITSPPTTEVQITGGVSGTGYPGTSSQLGLALVSTTIDLDFLLSFDLGNLFEDDVTAIYDGSACGGELPVPGNVHVPTQRFVSALFGSINCDIVSGVHPWTLRPYQGAGTTDLFALHATAVGSQVADADGMAQILGMMTFRNVALRSGVSLAGNATGQDFVLSHPLSANMPVSLTAAPLGDLYLFSISDLDGDDGLGRLIIQGMAVEEGVTSLSGDLTTHAADGVFAGKRDLALGLSLEIDGGGFSIELDRTTLGRTAPRTFDSLFDFPDAVVTGHDFSWSGVVRPGVSPDGYQLSRSILRRDRPRGDWKTHSENFWIVYAPGHVTGFTLPELPAWAPRAADDGFLLPEDSDQSIRWVLSLPHLGLLPVPGDFDLDRHELGREVEWLTHLSGSTEDLP